MFYPVYIPLCLYFNDHFGVVCGPSKHVYIPLCLYFNHLCKRHRCAEKTFTFHYVSSLIRPERVKRQFAERFTFHYVSILILFFLWFVVQIFLIYIPLCLYFNNLDSIKKMLSDDIYIPLCLYFNCSFKFSRPELT